MLHKDGVSYKVMKVQEFCAVCGTPVFIRPSEYKEKIVNQSFRCDEHKRKVPKGINHPLSKRTKFKCDFCGKEFWDIESSYKRPNHLGEIHHFCSHECYGKFRAIYYVKEKSPMIGHVYTEEQKRNLRAGCAKRAQSIDRLDTKIQLKVNDILDSMNIRYEREKRFDFYSCDNYLPDYNLIIEVMGDYWHANPNIYNDLGRKLNHVQRRTILKDKQKKSYIKGTEGISILYLWESDIKKEPQKCEKLISEYIKGLPLSDYHSFNYELLDGNLVLADNIITPYQCMSSIQYKHLLKVC